MRLADAVADVVRKQRELGIDIPDDGEWPRKRHRRHRLRSRRPRSLTNRLGQT